MKFFMLLQFRFHIPMDYNYQNDDLNIFVKIPFQKNIKNNERLPLASNLPKFDQTFIIASHSLSKTLPSNNAINNTSEFSNLWVDFNVDSELAMYICLWMGCQQKFIQQRDFEIHIDQHLDLYSNHLDIVPADLVCQIQGCQISVTSLEEFSRHLKMHTFHAHRQLIGLITVKERYPELRSCNFPATSRLVYQGEPLICEWNNCFLSFIDINEYTAHVDMHIETLDSSRDRNKRGEYTCCWNDCNVAIKHKAALRTHIQHHSGDKMCACPFCGAFFAHTSMLIEHVLRRQPGNPELMCQYCRKTFICESLLRKHCKRHIRQYKCDYCSLLSDTPHELNRHYQAVHAKVKNFICEHCGRGFYQRSDLNQHVILHFNDKMHECSLCGQRFRWGKQLRDHAKTHNTDYIQSPYQCHLCTLRYRRGSALSKHLTKAHKLPIPLGFSRFQYKKCSDALYRLQTLRYISEPLMIFDVPEGKEEQDKFDSDDAHHGERRSDLNEIQQ